MKLRCHLIVAMLAVAISTQGSAQQLVATPEGCYKDLFGKISCPPIGGEIHVDFSGKAVCGKGKCVRDLFGKVTCSNQPGGQITQDVAGKIMCVGACEEATEAKCLQLK